MAGRRAARGERPATYRDVFGVRDFRFLFVGHLLSVVGDELIRVALAILVFDATDSPLLAAATFGISYAPWILGGPFLATLADRLRRRSVLVGTDLARGSVVACLAIPGLPLWLMLVMLFAASLLAPPFESARSALMPDVLHGDRYAVGTSVTNISTQVGQVVGFLAGGLLVVVISARGALLVDAATFFLSALLVMWGVQDRPASTGEPGVSVSLWRETIEGLQVLSRNPLLLHIVGLLWVGQLFLTAPEGIAVPFVSGFGLGAVAVGLFLAANPVGLIVGGVIIGRFCPPDLRERLTYPLALMSMLPLIVAGYVNNFLLVLCLFAISGFGASYLIPLNVSFVRAVPPAFRGRAFGAAVAGLSACQGIGIVVAGAAAERMAASTVVSWSGALGLCALLLLGILGRRDRINERPDRPVESGRTSAGHPPAPESPTSGTIE